MGSDILHEMFDVFVNLNLTDRDHAFNLFLVVSMPISGSFKGASGDLDRPMLKKRGAARKEMGRKGMGR